MAKIFISYSREDESVVKALVGDLEAMGHDVWFDQELSGGQNWWDKILAQIRECDLFVIALAPASVDSTACRREYTYAGKLGKPIVPVLVVEGVSTNSLPPALSAVQIVDYRQQDRTAALRLARAIASTPPAPPMPDPLPEPPKVPLSYLGDLREQIDSESALSFDGQSALLIELKRSLRDAGTREDGIKLLRNFRRRRDLLATVAEEIDEILAACGHPASWTSPAPAKVVEEVIVPVPPVKAAMPPPSPAPVSEEMRPPASPVAVAPTPPEPASHRRPPPAWRERIQTAAIGGFGGTIVGVFAMMTYPRENIWWMGVFLGAGAAIVGLVAGRRRAVILVALAGGCIGGYLIGAKARADEFVSVVANIGFPLGAVPGALVGLIVEKLRSRQKVPVQAGASPLTH